MDKKQYTLETKLRDMMWDGCTLGDLFNVFEELKAQQNFANKSSLQFRINEVLNQFGVPANFKGRPYLMSAIEMAVKDPTCIDNVSNRLYPAVAKEFDIRASRVERNIRHAIAIAWDRGNPETYQDYFGMIVSPATGVPTNNEFIASISTTLRMEGYK